MGNAFCTPCAVVTVAFCPPDRADRHSLPRSWRRTIPMLRTSSTNSRRTAWNIRWGLITWDGVCSPA